MAAVPPLVVEYTKDWKRLQRQKIRHVGGVEARVLTNLGLVFGEHYINHYKGVLRARAESDDDANRLYLYFNMIGRAVWRKTGRLWSIDNQFAATPNTTDPAAFDNADVVSSMILAVNRKLKEKNQHWLRLFWLLVGGVVVEHTPWVENIADEALPVIDPESGEILWKDQFSQQVVPEEYVEQQIAAGVPPERFTPAEQVQTVGEVGSELFNPLNFFIDASVPSIDKLAGDQACYLAQVKTKSWIKDNFGSEPANQITRSTNLNIVTTRLNDSGPTVASLNLRDLIPTIQGSLEKDDPDMAIVLTRYSPRSEDAPSGKRCIFVPDGPLLDEIDLDSLGYEGIPCTDIHFRPNATSFWTGDFVTDMAPANKFLNKRMSQLGEAANTQIYELLLLGGGLTADDIPTDKPGVVENGISEGGLPLVAPVQHQGIPGWFVESIRLVTEFLDAIAGADLLSQRKFPGQLRGPLAIPMLQEILDSEDGPLYSHLGEQLAQIHQMRMNRVKAFYPAVRTMHYTGANNRDEVLVFHTDEVLRAGYDYTISIDPSTLLPELSSLREARVRERLESPLAILYVNPRTGRIDASKIADDLKYGDKQRESRGAQYRKLARQLIGKLWKGIALDPAIPLPFWDHDAMLDELEAAMATLEWLDASMPIKQAFVQLYEKHRAFLNAMQQAMEQSMQSTMMHSAVAQATQQAAAKAASLAVEDTMLQLDAQRDAAAGPPSLTDRTRQMMQAANAEGQQRRQAVA